MDQWTRELMESGKVETMDTNTASTVLAGWTRELLELRETETMRIKTSNTVLACRTLWFEIKALSVAYQEQGDNYGRYEDAIVGCGILLNVMRARVCASLILNFVLGNSDEFSFNYIAGIITMCLVNEGWRTHSSIKIKRNICLCTAKSLSQLATGLRESKFWNGGEEPFTEDKVRCLRDIIVHGTKKSIPSLPAIDVELAKQRVIENFVMLSPLLLPYPQEYAIHAYIPYFLKQWMPSRISYTLLQRINALNFITWLNFVS